jgi:hypothetical protein
VGRIKPRPTAPSDSYSADKIRQGEIVLTKPWMRIVFIAGLVLAVLLALFLAR